MKNWKAGLVALGTVMSIALLAPDSVADGKNKMKKFMKHMPKPVFVLPAPVPAVVVPAPHVHAFYVVSEQVWVPPVYGNQCIGYDMFGHPIYQQVVVTPGYFKTVNHQVCGCGHRIM